MRIIAFCWILLTCAFMADARPKELTYQGIRNFKLTQGADGNSLITLDVAFFNPNPYHLKMKKADISVYVNDHFLGTTLQDKMCHIPAQDSLQIPISVSVKLQDLLSNALQLLSSGSAMQFRFLGHVRVGRGMFFIRLPVDYTTTEKFLR
jgi:LEA14-like dessication related protein